MRIFCNEMVLDHDKKMTVGSLYFIRKTAENLSFSNFFSLGLKP